MNHELIMQPLNKQTTFNRLLSFKQMVMKQEESTMHTLNQKRLTSHKAKALVATLLSSALLLSACNSAPNTMADPSVAQVSQPPAARISDEVISSDLAAIQSYRNRLATFENDSTVSRYQQQKAMRWTDFAYDEYTDNDRSSVVSEALNEANVIITGLERDRSGKSLSMATPIINNSMLIRDDLWRRVKNYKQETYFDCVDNHVADAEVYLVWAGHEYQEMGWRHAVPQVHMAERAIRGVEAGLKDARQNKGCFKTTVREVIVEKPVERVVVSDEDIATMPRYVHFGVNEDFLTSESKRLLAEVVSVMNNHPDISLQVEGHTDPRGNAAKNAKLSKRRYMSVVNHLVNQGIAPSRLKGYAAGELEPLRMGCSPKDHALNRRATFVVTRGGEKVSVYDPVDDIKIKPSQPSNCGDGRR